MKRITAVVSSLFALFVVVFLAEHVLRLHAPHMSRPSTMLWNAADALKSIFYKLGEFIALFSEIDRVVRWIIETVKSAFQRLWDFLEWLLPWKELAATFIELGEPCVEIILSWGNLFKGYFDTVIVSRFPALTTLTTFVAIPLLIATAMYLWIFHRAMVVIVLVKITTYALWPLSYVKLFGVNVQIQRLMKYYDKLQCVKDRSKHAKPRSSKKQEIGPSETESTM